MTIREKIQIVWFKKDLRLTDHEPLFFASQQELKTILLFVLEPSWKQQAQTSERHVCFVLQSLVDMQRQLDKFNCGLSVFEGEAIEAFDRINTDYEIVQVLSYQETNIQSTFERDKKMAAWFKRKGIQWIEFQSGAVIRRLQNRKSWSEKQDEYLKSPQRRIIFEKLSTLSPSWCQFGLDPHSKPLFQPGGESNALKYLRSFLHQRGNGYFRFISKPEQSRIHCSRLSPYLAWGNLTVKQVWQATLQANQTLPAKDKEAFLSRLCWRDHFIQKFEMECEMETRNMNKAYEKVSFREEEAEVIAWANGQTGYPLIDAAMRCLNETGYLNFRMRAMLASFLSHHLWHHWLHAANHLARQFLDFEPGIHYPQLQMQAGLVGIHTIRIYNPVKQAIEHDPNASFIKKWVPELAKLPTNLALQPWTISPLEESFLGFTPGTHYPKPIVNIEVTGAYAANMLWKLKQQKEVQIEAGKILARHTLKNRIS